MNNQNTLQRVYSWLGFFVFWSLVLMVLGSLVVGQDRTIDILVKLFS